MQITIPSLQAETY